MSKDDFGNWLGAIIIVVLIFVAPVVGVAIWIDSIFGTWAQRGCENLGERIGYNTEYFSGACQIEIRPNLWISEYEVAELLPLIDCEKDF